MTTRSKAVDEAIKNLYAIMATAAAAKAISRIEWNDVTGADVWAKDHARWLEKAGSKATGWHYSRPKLPSR
jgi:hypothetical protein